MTEQRPSKELIAAYDAAKAQLENLCCEPLPSKDLIQRLAYCVNGCEFMNMPETAAICREAIAEIERLQRELREYQAAHANLLLRVKDCPNCDAGAAHEPRVILVKGTCSICGKEFEGHPGDNACHPCWLGYEGMTAEELAGACPPPPAEQA